MESYGLCTSGYWTGRWTFISWNGVLYVYLAGLWWEPLRLLWQSMLEHYIYFHSGVAASLDFVYWSNHSRVSLWIMWIQLLVLSSMSLGLIHLHSSRKGVRIFWADIDLFGARWICSCCSHRCSRETLTMTLQSIWCIDIVGEITINDLNLWLESVIVVPTMTLEYVQFCDLVIPWHRGWHFVMFWIYVILWLTVMELWWSEYLHDFVILWTCDVMVDTTMTSKQSTSMVDTTMTSKQSTILWTSTLWLRNDNLKFWFYVVWDQTGRNRYFPLPSYR